LISKGFTIYAFILSNLIYNTLGFAQKLHKLVVLIFLIPKPLSQNTHTV